MSKAKYKSLLFCISDRLEEINTLKDGRVRKHVLFMCNGKIAHRDDDTFLSLLSKLEENGFLGVDSLQLLKDILKAEAQWDFLDEIAKFETIRGEYKKLLEQFIGALEERNDLERLTSIAWRKWNMPEEKRNSVRDVRSLFQVLEEMNCIGVDSMNLFREFFIESNDDELLTKLEEFQNRRTKDEKSERGKAQRVAVWSFAGAVYQRIRGVVKVHCTLQNLAAGSALVISIGVLLRKCRTLQDYVEVFERAILPPAMKLLGLTEKCVCFMVQAETTLALQELHERYSTGRLQKDLQEFLVTDDIRQLADTEEVEVFVHINEKEFREARDDLINVVKEEAKKECPKKEEKKRSLGEKITIGVPMAKDFTKHKREKERFGESSEEEKTALGVHMAKQIRPRRGEKRKVSPTTVQETKPDEKVRQSSKMMLGKME